MSTDPQQTCAFIGNGIITYNCYFNELVQYDHMKICPSDNKNTRILVINDHFSQFAEAVPCHHDEYDATSTSRKIVCEAWNSNSHAIGQCPESNCGSYQLIFESVTDHQSHIHDRPPWNTRSSGKAKQNPVNPIRSLLFQGMRDWDQHLDEVMGAYNSTLHATTGFLHYLLTRGTKKAIPHTYLNPEVVTR